MKPSINFVVDYGDLVPVVEPEAEHLDNMVHILLAVSETSGGLDGCT